MKKLLTIFFIFSFYFSKSQVVFTATDEHSGFAWTANATVADNLGMTRLIASKTGVVGNALASTALDFVSGVSLTTHSPVFCLIKFASGVLGISVLRIKTDGGYLVGVTAMSTLTATDNNYLILLTGAIRNTGNISVEVTTAGLGASTFDCYVFGIKKQ